MTPLQSWAGVAVAVAVVAATAARAWVVSTVPVKLDSGGETRLVDTHHHLSYPRAVQPGCEIIGVIFTPNEGSPFPQGNEVWLVALSDPDHANEIKGEGCVNHANGACTDEVYSFRVNYRHLFSNAGRALSYNWCIPKGWKSECDYMPLNATCPDINPGTYNCPRCDGANDCDTKTYGRYCQTWNPSAKVGVDANGNDIRTGINPSSSQGDCHFSYEIAVFNKRPKSCRVEPFQIHAFHPSELVHQGNELHYSVVVEGDDADLAANEKLEFWLRSFPDHCREYKKWFDATAAADRTRTVQQCAHPSNGDQYYHGISTLQPDTGMDFARGQGVGQHCAGHGDPSKCSPKHFSDEMFPFGRCRITGCAALPTAMQMPDKGDTCAYGDLVASTNFDFDLTVTETAQSACAANDPESHRFYELLFHGTSKAAGNLGTKSTMAEEPNFCCNIAGVHQANPRADQLFPDGAGGGDGMGTPIPCGIGPDGRQMVFDACNVCGGTGNSCKMNTAGNSQGTGSGAPRAAVATVALPAAA
eukprot:CAMPEP_0198337028 /NCGR_PEP_ID=MMETSP1450-20131203/24351_1 /TAXON_ID=753684 ORGANISM="Madagascaria erythrocladiodes, Strain CCMP3234" /NCGR_SAMPLE_ID=MMETSP1450 /ASSEMBLY_ACC=CAM_ASM_001115 /LENGTH=529 /DNA_ID=CAMNT_0044041801 /DNA_START=120 /DNA_END=1706 /DNA_ORIENTATION=+